jgi:hypothetical protein
MNRNNGRKIAERLMLLEDFFIKNADKTHAVSMEAIRCYYLDNGIEGENRQGDGSFVSGRTRTKEPSPCLSILGFWRGKTVRIPYHPSIL